MEHRSFMTLDKNAYVKLTTDDEGCWMGSVLTGYDFTAFTVEASDPDFGDGFDKIELYGPGRTLIGMTECMGEQVCLLQFQAPVTAPTFFVAKAIQTDDEYLVSAPLWVGP